eukprot:m.542974 g.542974  ORF g.542974 m.542974 type:complete len:1700 (-) comp22123_c0_seq1:169-5268(-)
MARSMTLSAVVAARVSVLLYACAFLRNGYAQEPYEPPLTGDVDPVFDHLIASDIAMLTNCNGNDSNPAFTPSPYNGSLEIFPPNSTAAFGTPPNGDYPQTLRSEVTLLQKQSSPWTYYPSMRGVPRSYHVQFRFHQHPRNSVQNDPDQIPRISFTFALVPRSALPSTHDGSATALCADANLVRNCPRRGGCAAIARVRTSPAAPPAALEYTASIDIGGTDAYANTSVWHDVDVDFAVELTCHDCVLAVQILPHSWISRWGIGYFFANMSVSSNSVTLPPAPPPVTGNEHPRFTPRRMPVRGPTTPSACPHDRTDLALWNATSTWPNGTVPRPTVGLHDALVATVVLPADHTVLLTADVAAWSSPAQRFGVIEVPPSSTLVFADADMHLYVSELRVLGRLWIGAETCPVTADITITFQGNKSHMGAPGLAGVTKGLVVAGGHADIHGATRPCTWTRLGASVFAGDRHVRVQDTCGFRAGDTLVLTSTIYRDLEQNQNEIVVVAAVAPDGHILQLRDAVRFDHYGGPEYQAEVAWVDRNVRLEGWRNDSDATAFGGHTVVTGGGQGRFSGVELVRMGQQNVLGRYPLHFHLLDPPRTYADELASANVRSVTDGPSVVETSEDWIVGGADLPDNYLLGSGPNATWLQNCDYRRSYSQCAIVKSIAFAFPDSPTTPGAYELQLVRPSRTMVRTIGLGTGAGMAHINVTTDGDPEEVLAAFTYDFAQSNPVGSMKRWDVVGRFLVPGVDNVTLRVNLRTWGVAGEVVAVAAVRFVSTASPPHNYVRDCSVHDSYYRCVSIHGSHNVTLSRNVAHNVSGHCFYLEDGVEERNTIEYNLAAYIHPIFEPARGFGQTGAQYVQSAALLNPADTGAAGFYLTNAYNTVVGNAASGGWTGFSFPNLPRPLGPFGAYAYGNFDPWARPVLVFDGNTAHSAGYHAPFGNCLYVGGRLQINPSTMLLQYSPGREGGTRDQINASGATVPTVLRNMLVALCNIGIQHWGNDAVVEDFEVYDSEHGVVTFGSSYVHRGHIIGTTNNTQQGTPAPVATHRGFQYYDTRVQTLLDDVHFDRFVLPADAVDIPADGSIRAEYSTRVFDGMDHSDTFKPQGIAAQRNISYGASVTRRSRFDFPGNDVGSAYMYNIVDADGASVGFPYPAIIGSHIDWWNVGCGCVRDDEWRLWICDKVPGREIGYLVLDAPTVTVLPGERSTIEAHRHVGYLCRGVLSSPVWMDDADLHGCMIMTKNPGHAGITNGVWHYRFFGGPLDPATQHSPRGGLVGTASPAAFNITTMQLIKGTFIVLAMKYPAGTNFSVSIFQQHVAGGAGFTIPVPEADSLIAVLSPHEQLRDVSTMDVDNTTDCPGTAWDRLCARGGTGPTWFFDAPSQTFFLRVVNPLYYLRRSMHAYESADRFAHDGLALGNLVCCGRASYTVTTSCAEHPGAASRGLCHAGALVPGATRPSGDACTEAQTEGPWGLGILPPRHDLAAVAYAGETTALWQVRGRRSGTLQDRVLLPCVGVPCGSMWVMHAWMCRMLVCHRCRRAVRAGSSTTHQCAECPSEGRCPSRPPPATPCSSCRRSPRCMRVISLPTPPKGSCCSRSPTGCSRSTWPLPPVEHTTSHPAATATAPRAWRWWWRWGPTAPTAALWRARCPTAPCNPAWPRAQKIRGLAFRCCRASGGRCRHGSSTTHSPAPPRADVVTGCPSRKC